MAKLHPDSPLAAILQADYHKDLHKDAQAFFGKLGMELFKLLLQAEVIEKCGPKHAKNPERKNFRWGSDAGFVSIRGAKEEIVKPRVRTADGSKEVQLECYRSLSDGKWLTEKILNSVLNGVSTRNFARLLESSIQKRGVSKSTVSRTSIAATKPQLEAFLKRSLQHLNLVAIMIDGIHFNKRQMIVAIGISHSGHKHVLGLRLGATENVVVTRDLIGDLIDRGLDAEKKYLFVIDGSKALSKAISAAFGDRAIIQRCQEHKIRNVLAYLPRKCHAEFRSKLTAAYSTESVREAGKRLESLRRELAKISEAASLSLLEGMVETLSLQRLGITGALYTSLRTTNAIESAFSSVRRHTGRTTRYRNDQQVYLWACRGLLCAEKNFRILPGHRQVAALRQKLDSFDPASQLL